mgnify:FL=1
MPFQVKPTSPWWLPAKEAMSAVLAVTIGRGKKGANLQEPINQNVKDPLSPATAISRRTQMLRVWTQLPSSAAEQLASNPKRVSVSASALSAQF